MGEEAAIARIPSLAAARKAQQKGRREEAAQAQCYDTTAHGKNSSSSTHKDQSTQSLRQNRNPEKYDKNLVRNKARDIELERRNIWNEAVRQAQELAMIHDPSGAKFNVQPVTRREDGRVVDAESGYTFAQQDRLAAMKIVEGSPALFDYMGRPISKRQQKRFAEEHPRPRPPKPVIPEGISVPDDEENFLALWDLSSEQIGERLERIKREKRGERKDLRQRQQAGKFERRCARDEKRRVYRELKQTWRVLKGIYNRDSVTADVNK